MENEIDRRSSDRDARFRCDEHNFWDDRAFRRAATIEMRLYTRKMT